LLTILLGIFDSWAPPVVGITRLGGCLVASGLVECTPWYHGILVLEAVGSDVVLPNFKLPVAHCPVCSVNTSLLSDGDLLTANSTLSFVLINRTEMFTHTNTPLLILHT